MAHKFEVEYAKSNRAACKQCKAKIDKDAVRFGYSQDVPAGDDGVKNYAMGGTKWYHFQCFPNFKGVKWMKMHLCEIAALTGYDGLQMDDQKTVKELWEAIKAQAETGGNKQQKRAAAEGLAELTEVGAHLQGHKKEKNFQKNDSVPTIFKFVRNAIGSEFEGIEDMYMITATNLEIYFSVGNRRDLFKKVLEDVHVLLGSGGRPRKSPPPAGSR